MTTIDLADRFRMPHLEEDTARVLDTVDETLCEYIVFPSDAARAAVVLWTAHCHVFESFESTPRLSVSSSEPGSGKSRVLELIEHLVPHPLVAAYITPAVMWRMIEHRSATILIDEADIIFGRNGSSSAHRYLRGIINAGHRAGAVVPRTSGSEDVKLFKVFSPVAMAGLGKLPETIATRSIPIVMRKRRDDDPPVRPFRLKYAQHGLKRTHAMLQTWAASAADVLAFSAPELPVKDRPADVWEPLVAIAEAAGEEWHARALAACEELTAVQGGEETSPGLRLLTDVRSVWDADADSMFTYELLLRLAELDDAPWTALDARKLGRMLSEYGISSTTVRQGDQVAKGYKLAHLERIWDRLDVPAPQAEEPDEL